MRLSLSAFLGIFLVLSFAFPGMASDVAQAPTISPEVVISKPRAGEALQGVMIVEGRIRGDSLSSARLMFRYASETSSTWFYILEVDFEDEGSSQQEFRLEWDTTTVSDGNYDLRVIAVYRGGQEVGATVSNLRIRNYSPIETTTPRPLGTTSPTQATLETPERTPVPTPTPFPPNAVTLQRGEIINALEKGLAAAGGLFLALGVYHVVKKWRR